MTADTAPAVDSFDHMVEAADTEASEADSLVDALEERVLAGDADVTASEFEQAQGLAKFARKRAEGARRRKAAAESAQLVDATAALVEHFDAATARRSVVLREGREKFEAAVQKAATEWMRSARECDRQIRDVVAEANGLDIPMYNVSERQGVGPRKFYDRVVIAGRADLMIGEASRQVIRFLEGPEFADGTVAACVSRLERDAEGQS